MALSKEELEKGVQVASGVNELWFTPPEGRSLIRFIEFQHSPNSAGLFDIIRAHWAVNYNGRSHYFVCKTQFGSTCPFCEYLFKTMRKVRDEDLRSRLYGMRAKDSYITWVTVNEKPDGSGNWSAPKLWRVGPRTATEIMHKFLNIVDGEYYPPDGNPSYALIITKQRGTGGQIISNVYDLSRRIYEIPKFEVKPILEVLGEPDYDEAIRMADEWVKTKLMQISDIPEDPEEAMGQEFAQQYSNLDIAKDEEEEAPDWGE